MSLSTTIYESFINSNVAPYSADAIGIFNSNGELINKIKIDGFKPSYTDRLFRFGILFPKRRIAQCLTF